MILSFAKTLEEYLSCEKIHTRRIWKPGHHETWENQIEKGNFMHQAYSKIPIAGGVEIGEFLLFNIYYETLNEMPEADVSKEGFPTMSKEDFISEYFPGTDRDRKISVVVFETYAKWHNYETVESIEEAERRRKCR